MNGNMFRKDNVVEIISGSTEADDMIKLKSCPFDSKNAVRVYSSGGRFVGIYNKPVENDMYKPVKMFLS